MKNLINKNKKMLIKNTLFVFFGCFIIFSSSIFVSFLLSPFLLNNIDLQNNTFFVGAIYVTIAVFFSKCLIWCFDFAKYIGEKNIKNKLDEKIIVMQKLIGLMIFQYKIENNFSNTKMKENIQSLIIEYNSIITNRIYNDETKELDNIINMITLILKGRKSNASYRYLRIKEKKLKEMYYNNY